MAPRETPLLPPDGRAKRPARRARSRDRSLSPSPRSPRKPPAERTRPKESRSRGSSKPSSSNLLSEDSLAQLNASYEREQRRERKKQLVQEKRVSPAKEDRQREKRRASSGPLLEKEPYGERERERVRRRVISGPLLEEGRVEGHRLRRRGGNAPSESTAFVDMMRRRKRLYIVIGVVVVLLVIFIPVGIVVSKKKNDGDGASSKPAGSSSSSPADIPTAAKGTVLDPFTWYETTDFNTTYTNETVGGLPIMGLMSSWDDSTQANEHVPALDKPWQYGKLPIRGVNIGGWLSLEPFITPSLFDYDSKLGIVDEWTLTTHLGVTGAAQTLEKHYATFVNEQTFSDIAAAGLDHVRIPFSYWALATYPGDPYVPKTSWRYLLRGIEWARKHGLRINLDLHALPGSQNGWNHSGRLGAIGWLNGTDGDLNAQRSLDIHAQLSAFFAQPRYRNIIGIYGIVNEPKMTALPLNSVVAWTKSAIDVIRRNGITAPLAFGDGFLGLPNWHGQLAGIPGLVLDVHPYLIFNAGQIGYTHAKKVAFACQGWTDEINASMNPSTGYGPTLCGEWSQADTDCAPYINNIGRGTRWTGTLNTGDAKTSVLTPLCPPSSGPCDCAGANADPASYSAGYKVFLQAFAEAQMASFERGWGWFYWTWDTEAAVQWSWKKGLAAGILPAKAYAPAFNCTQDPPTFSGLPENY
ncbi:MAG: hypothetical protein M1829_004769 [Trizodia sp. TS-e1964]|nr:MAG: hypothetical protein M1829_004769 [Trizodia sp. TS-e1964]